MFKPGDLALVDFGDGITRLVNIKQENEYYRGIYECVDLSSKYHQTWYCPIKSLKKIPKKLQPLYLTVYAA